MAGGGGTRLWPLSRAAAPQAVPAPARWRPVPARGHGERLAPLVEPATSSSSPTRATTARPRSRARRRAGRNILGEPHGRNTAAAVALAAHAIDRPGDEVDRSSCRPTRSIARRGRPSAPRLRPPRCGGRRRPRHARRRADRTPRRATATSLATGEATLYGGRADATASSASRRSPARARAQELSTAARAYWNAGHLRVAARRAARRGSATRARHRRADRRVVRRRRGRARTLGRGRRGHRGRLRRSARPRIDYALLEPASIEGRVAVVPMSVGWDDLGSWSALATLRGGDGADGNVLDAPGGAASSRSAVAGVLVHADGGRLVALVGVSTTSSSSTRPTRCSSARRTPHRTSRRSSTGCATTGRTDLL